jgi:hypothetical protein
VKAEGEDAPAEVDEF